MGYNHPNIYALIGGSTYEVSVSAFLKALHKTTLMGIPALLYGCNDHGCILAYTLQEVYESLIQCKE
jgi:hypothetical protein